MRALTTFAIVKEGLRPGAVFEATLSISCRGSIVTFYGVCAIKDLREVLNTWIDNPTITMNVRKVALITILVALSIATNYALIGVTNVTVMDLIVFVTGFFFGPILGAMVGMFSWMIYGVINPYGFVPQIYVATILAETIYGLLGGVLGRKLLASPINGHGLKLSLFFGVIGFTSTLIWDLATTVVYALAFDLLVIPTIVMGVPFTLVHELSNTAFFILGCVPIIVTVKSFLGAEGIEHLRFPA